MPKQNPYYIAYYSVLDADGNIIRNYNFPTEASGIRHLRQLFAAAHPATAGQTYRIYHIVRCRRGLGNNTFGR